MRLRRSVLPLLPLALLLPGLPAASAAADTAPPQLQSFSFTPTQVDTTNGPATVVVTYRVTDETDVQKPDFIFSSTTTTQATSLVGAQTRLVSGTAQDGTWQTTTVLPQGAAPGTWKPTLYPLSDSRGNSGTFGPGAAYPATLQNGTTAAADTAPPQLQSFSFTPTQVDTTNGPATVVVTYRVTDETDVQKPDFIFSSTTTTQATSLVGAQTRLVSGTAQDGTWQTTTVLPQGAAPGTWKPTLYPLSDSRGNSGTFGPGAAYPATLQNGTTAPPSTTPSATPATASPADPAPTTAPTATTSPTPPTSPAPAASPRPTAPAATGLRLMSAAGVVRYGVGTTLTARLTPASGGTAVQVLQRARGASAWSPLATVTTADDGTARVTVAPTRSTEYVVRFPGDARRAASASSPVLVQVAQAVTVRASTSRATRGQKVTLTGTVSPAHTGRAVVQRQVGSAWRDVVAGALKNGRYSTTVALPTAGRWALRVVVRADADHAAGTSPTVVVTVR